MPPRSPASSVRRGAGRGHNRTRNAEGRHHQHQHGYGFAAPPPVPTTAGVSPSFRAMATPAAEPVDQGGGGGESGGACFPALFHSPAPESPASSEAGSDDSSESSSTSSSSGAILALGEREEADSRDELIGIFVPALDPAEGGRGGRHPSPLLPDGDRKVNADNDMSASSSSSGSMSPRNANSARIMFHHRALSSTCLEGLEPANHHHRRERSGSLLGERGREIIYYGSALAFLFSFSNQIRAPRFFKMPSFESHRQPSTAR